MEHNFLVASMYMHATGAMSNNQSLKGVRYSYRTEYYEMHFPYQQRGQKQVSYVLL
jgi:hypothetical protein